jgi:hypothetical protein
MRLFITIVFVFFAFLTEGVAQEVIEQPSPDSTEVYDEDMTGEEDATEDVPYVNPYQAATDKYKQTPVNRTDFDPKAWEKAKDGIDYTLEPEKQDTASRTKRNNQPTHRPLNSEALIAFLKWFFIGGAILIVAYLVYRFATEGDVFGRRSRRIGTPSVGIDLENIEDNLEETDIESFIKKAIGSGQYNVAIRLYYLAILKELSLSDSIKWQKEKTNRAYIFEMKNHPQADSFRQITRTYERVWYGNSTINAAIFNYLKSDFEALLKTVKGRYT